MRLFRSKISRPVTILLVTLCLAIVGNIVAEFLPPLRADVNASTNHYGPEPLVLAASNHNMDRAEFLLAHGADVNSGVPGGVTPLAAAVEGSYGGTEMVELLLEHGANVNAGDVNGDTPLSWAVKGKGFLVAKLLLAHGAEVNAKGYGGMTPLHEAASLGNKEIAELLLAHGAEVNARSNDGLTPLHEAAGNGDKDMVEWLLAQGADVNAKDNNGMTPLHEAVAMGNKDAVELLLAHQANVNARNIDGRTPLYWAEAMGKKEMADLLLAHGADVKAKGDDDQTPLAQFITKSDGHGGLVITRYTGPGGAVSIPDTINGLPVTRIGGYTEKPSMIKKGAFQGDDVNYGNYYLTSVTIPSSVRSIGADAFLWCRNLTGVYFKGNSPSFNKDIYSNNDFRGDNHAIIYCLPSTSGWGTKFDGRPTAPWKP